MRMHEVLIEAVSRFMPVIKGRNVVVKLNG